MFPSSLVFVVILAVWAVYLVQHWVRRREHIATAKSVDRFSESMRVLERRRAMPRPELAEPAPRSYAVSPLRPARPEVTVKRAASTARATGRARRTLTAARLRATALLVGLAAMLVGITATLLDVVSWWGAAAGVGMALLAFVGVRISVRREQGAARASRVRPVALSARSSAAQSRASQSHAVAPGRSSAAVRHRRGLEVQAREEKPAHAFAAQSAAVAARTAGGAPRVARAAATRPAVAAPALYDIAEIEAALTPAPKQAAAPTIAPEVASADQPAEPGSWSPVPVPPPTYTLKAKAYRGDHARGSAELPVDGMEMALEDEFEELPQVFRVVG